MAYRVFITGSADGLGLLAAQKLVEQGHRVVLHARNLKRAEEALARVPRAEGVLIGDLNRPEEVRRLAEDANGTGTFHAIIHNAGVYHASSEEILRVNVLAPYALTALIQKPQRLIYVSSNMHLHARPELHALESGQISYSDSKFYLVLLMKAVARRWRDVYANAVDPGWVPTKMGGPNAPDDLEAGVATQVWLAVSEEAKVNGRYFYHMREVAYHPQADDIALQEAFLQVAERLTGIVLPESR